jgi:hypothetical protein
LGIHNSASSTEVLSFPRRRESIAATLGTKVISFISFNFKPRTEDMTEIKIPVLDLKPQYEQIKDEVQAVINRVLESGQFIMGPDVKLFEQEVAEYWGVKRGDRCQLGDRCLGDWFKGVGNWGRG